MKKFLFIALLCFISVIVFAEADGTVLIKNETGYTLNYIYFSPSDYDDWGDDFLNGRILEDGSEVEIKLAREIDEGKLVYDLQAVDEDDDYYTIYETDISENNIVTITMDAYDGGDYDDYDDYDYSGYEEGYNEGYSEGYKQGYIEAFRDAYLEGFKAARDTDFSGKDDYRESFDGGWQ